MKKEEKEFTWADLKRIVNRMPKKHLSKPVVIWEGDSALRVEGVEVLKQDYLYDGDEGCCPRSEMKDVLEENKQLSEEDQTDFYVVHEKGTRILYAE